MKHNFEVGTFNCSEDEMNNFWIDLYVAQRDFELERLKNIEKTISAISGKTVTITLTKENHTFNHE